MHSIVPNIVDCYYGAPPSKQVVFGRNTIEEYPLSKKINLERNHFDPRAEGIVDRNVMS